MYHQKSHLPEMISAENKKDSHKAVFLGEGIFTMGYSKNYIMYWGFLQLL